MPVPKHLDEAVARLKESLIRIDAARAKSPTLDSLREWLSALTDHATAQSDIQAYNNESVHEKLHEIAGRSGVVTRPRSARKGQGRT